MKTTNETWGLIAGRTIATPQGDFSIVKTDNWKGRPTDLDNIARLCASAPDLLQVVEDYVLLCELHDYVGAVPDAARAALRKAQGGKVQSLSALL